MSTVSIYSFADATGLTQYVDSVGDFQFSGTWSGSGTYFASPLTAAQYGQGLYMCIRDNVGDNPLRPPTRIRPASWSIMSLLYEYQSSGTQSSAEVIAEAAYALAESGTNIAWAAYYLAQIGTNTGSAAYSLAGSAISTATNALTIANGAFTIAVAGTNAAASAQSAADAAYQLAQIGTNTGTAALTLATSGSNVAWQAYLIAVAGSNTASDGSLAYSAWNLAQIGTNTGSTAYSVAQAAYALAQIGTNTGTAAYDLAQTAYNIAIAASGSTSGSVAIDAYLLAQTGTNLGYAAYALAQIGTNTGTAAYSLATAGSNLAWEAYLLASSSSPAGVSELPWAGTITVDFAGSLYQTVSIQGDTHFLGTNYAPGRSITVEMTGAITSNLTFDPSWQSVNASFPSSVSLTAGAKALLALLSLGTTASRVDIGYAASDTEIVVGSGSEPVGLAAYALAQVGTNTGTAAYDLATTGSNLAWTAYQLALSAESGDGSLAYSAWTLAQIGTNTGSTAYSVAQAAYALAQIGTETGGGGTYVYSTTSGTASVQLPVQSARFPSTSFARLDASEQEWRLLYAKGESAQWQFMVPQDYGSALKAHLMWGPANAQVGTSAVGVFGVGVAASSDNDSTAVQSKTFVYNYGTITVAANTGSGIPLGAVITLSGSDSLAAGDFCQIKIERSNFTADTLAGDIAVYGIALEYASSGPTGNSVVGYGTVPTSTAISGTMYYDFTGSAYQETSVGTNLWISGVNMSAGRELSIILVPDGTTYALGFDAFKWFGTSAPASITSSEIIVSFFSKDNTIANTRACWIQQF